MIIGVSNLLNSGSKSMNVDGSGTPKSFTFSPSQTTAIIGISCILKDDGTTSLNKFGAITALTNGILIQATIGGVTTDLTTIKDNADLCTRFNINQFGNSSVLSILGVSTPLGFGNSNNVFVGFFDFLPPLFLTLDSGDSLTAIVRDDLNNIDLLEMSVKTVI